ncbi:hypothetical protein ABK040_003006 [Willaertia magna]
MEDKSSREERLRFKSKHSNFLLQGELPPGGESESKLGDKEERKEETITDHYQIFENIKKEKERNEPYQMYFYYPKYLHPEAVALIAQNLLNEWEDEEEKEGNHPTSQVSTTKDDTNREDTDLKE